MFRPSTPHRSASALPLVVVTIIAAVVGFFVVQYVLSREHEDLADSYAGAPGDGKGLVVAPRGGGDGDEGEADDEDEEEAPALAPAPVPPGSRPPAQSDQVGIEALLARQAKA